MYKYCNLFSSDMRARRTWWSSVRPRSAVLANRWWRRWRLSTPGNRLNTFLSAICCHFFELQNFFFLSPAPPVINFSNWIFDISSPAPSVVAVSNWIFLSHYFPCQVWRRAVSLQTAPVPDVRVHDQLHSQAEAPSGEVHDEQCPWEFHHSSGWQKLFNGRLPWEPVKIAVGSFHFHLFKTRQQKIFFNFFELSKYCRKSRKLSII